MLGEPVAGKLALRFPLIIHDNTDFKTPVSAYPLPIRPAGLLAGRNHELCGLYYPIAAIGGTG